MKDRSAQRPAPGMPARAAVIRLPIGASNRAIAALAAGQAPVPVQRYFLGAATRTSSNRALLAQMKAPDGSFRKPTDPTHTKYNRKRRDPTALTPSGRQPLRISEDGRMAIENVTDKRQAKVFFAEPSIYQKSNETLAKVGSAFLLQARLAGAIDVPDESGAKTRTLDSVEAVANPEAGKSKKFKKVKGQLATQPHGPTVSVAATCNAVARMIMGHDDVLSNKKLKALKLFTPTEEGQWASALAEAMTTQGKRATGPINEAAIAQAYANLLQNQPVTAAKMAKKLAVNEFAEPKVGQAYATTAIGIMPGLTEKVGWTAAADAGLHNPALKVPDAANRSGKRRLAWGNHIGAVVAVSAENRVTFENYARDAEDGAVKDQDQLGYFAMYGPVTKPTQTWHSTWTTGNVKVTNGITAVV